MKLVRLLVLVVLLVGFSSVVAQDTLEYVPGCYAHPQQSVYGDIATISEENHLVINGIVVPMSDSDVYPMALCSTWSADGEFIAVQYLQPWKPLEYFVQVFGYDVMNDKRSVLQVLFDAEAPSFSQDSTQDPLLAFELETGIVVTKFNEETLLFEETHRWMPNLGQNLIRPVFLPNNREIAVTVVDQGDWYYEIYSLLPTAQGATLYRSEVVTSEFYIFDAEDDRLILRSGFPNLAYPVPEELLSEKNRVDHSPQVTATPTATPNPKVALKDMMDAVGIVVSDIDLFYGVPTSVPTRAYQSA